MVVAGDGNNWNANDPQRMLYCVSDGMWRGRVALSKERVKFFADGDVDKSWGKQDGSNIEPMEPGVYEVTFDERRPFSPSFVRMKGVTKSVGGY